MPYRSLPHVLVVAALLLGGCRSARPLEVEEAGSLPAQVTYTTVSDSLAEDPAVEAMVAPYRNELAARVAEVIGEARAPLEKAAPEGALGNMAADAMLNVVQPLVDEPVHMALTNNGGLRVPIPAGPITVGVIYELMPFENALTVLTLSGLQVDSLAQQLARLGGEPIAGFSFQILAGSRRAVNIQVQGRALDREARYRLVTSDYLADGGGGLPVLWEPLDRQDLSFLLRDAFIQYIRGRGTLEPSFDGRITVVDEEAYLR